MPDPQTLGQILGVSTAPDRDTMERVLNGLRGENASGQESAATGGMDCC